MWRQKLLEVLKSAEKPLTTEELHDLTGVALPRLRAELLRLAGEGRIERKQVEGRVAWALKTPTRAELRYEKLAKKFTP